MWIESKCSYCENIILVDTSSNDNNQICFFCYNNSRLQLLNNYNISPPISPSTQELQNFFNNYPLCISRTPSPQLQNILYDYPLINTKKQISHFQQFQDIFL